MKLTRHNGRSGQNGTYNPKQTKTYEGREVNEIMNNAIVGWSKSKQHRFSRYGQQRAWKRDIVVDAGSGDAFQPIPEQMTIPFEDKVCTIGMIQDWKPMQSIN